VAAGSSLKDPLRRQACQVAHRIATSQEHITMSIPVIVAGVGMTPFVKPGTEPPYTVMGASAVRMALEDAGLGYEQIQQAYTGYVYGDSTAGQAVLYGVGMTGIPVINVNNNCSTGSTALYLARQAIEFGVADCVLALGFEQMARGAIDHVFQDRPTPLGRFLDLADELQGHSASPMAVRLFGGAGAEYQERYDTADATFAAIVVKARRHAQHNERSIFRKLLTVEDVLAGLRPPPRAGRHRGHRRPGHGHRLPLHLRPARPHQDRGL
jgi:sterol carrier protein 2